MKARAKQRLVEHIDAAAGDEIEARASAGEPGDDCVVFVHRCCGEVDEVRPADAVRLTDTEVAVLFDGMPVATYKRDDVFFATRRPDTPPVVG